MNPVDVGDDLTIAIDDRSVRVTPGGAFRLAERLIRKATVRMITEEAEVAETAKRVSGNRGGADGCR